MSILISWTIISIPLFFSPFPLLDGLCFLWLWGTSAKNAKRKSAKWVRVRSLLHSQMNFCASLLSWWSLQWKYFSICHNLITLENSTPFSTWRSSSSFWPSLSWGSWKLVRRSVAWNRDKGPKCSSSDRKFWPRSVSTFSCPFWWCFPRTSFSSLWCRWSFCGSARTLTTESLIAQCQRKSVALFQQQVFWYTTHVFSFSS